MMDILFYLVIMFVSILLIVLSCVVFTNAIEHLGEHLGLSNRTMGSIFAAIGTGLPETIVPIVAILGAYITHQPLEFSKQIGIGAILGSPFMISTFAIFITGVFIFIFAKMKFRDLSVNIDKKPILRDIKIFLISYTIALFASVIKFPYSKFIFALLLLSVYFTYIIRTIKKDDREDKTEEDIPLYFQIIPTNAKVHSMILILQILLSVIGIVYFSHLFVKSVIYFAQITQIHPMILSLFLAPVATELPEMLNSIIWVKGSKDNFAFANLTGAIVYQASVLTAIGVLFTDWVFNKYAFMNVLLVYASVLTFAFILFKSKKISVKILFLNGFYWLIYVIYAVLTRG